MEKSTKERLMKIILRTPHFDITLILIQRELLYKITIIKGFVEKLG